MDCDDGYFCESQSCTEGCKSDEECDNGEQCTLGVCEELSGCLSDFECSAGIDMVCEIPGGQTFGNCVIKSCFDDADCDDLDNSTIDACVSDVCEYYPAHCSNEVLDEDEGDIDCGGSECVICAELSSCNENADCETDYCYTAICEYECDDGDDSGEDITTKSTTTGYLYGTDEYNSYEEICYTDTIVTEYYCQDNRVMEVNYPCSGNETCSNGACS